MCTQNNTSPWEISFGRERTYCHEAIKTSGNGVPLGARRPATSPGTARNALSGRGQPTSPLWASVFFSIKRARWERWFLNCLSALIFVFVSKFKKGRKGSKRRGRRRKIFEFYSAGLGKCHYFELPQNGPSNFDQEKKK